MSSSRFRRFGAIISAALFGLAVVGPNVAVAAGTPTVAVGSSSPDVNGTSATPGTVSIGDTVRFQTSLRNDDSSTISQLYLAVFSDATLYSYGKPLTYAVTFTKNDSTVNGACGIGTNGAQINCSVRNVKPHEWVTATFVLKIPTTYSDGTAYAGSTDSNGSQRDCPIGDGIGYANVTAADIPVLTKPATCVLSMWSSTGAPSSDGGNSHGDTWNFNDGVAINGNVQDFRGRYVQQNGQSIVENDQDLREGNPHSTRAYAPSTGIPVTVEDIDCTTSTNTLCAYFTTGFGQVSRIDVNGGADVSGTAGTTLLHFYMKLSGSEVPNGANANNVNILHFYDDGTGTGTFTSETISERCATFRGSSTPTNACITVAKLKGGGLAIDVWTYHNGGLRGF